MYIQKFHKVNFHKFGRVFDFTYKYQCTYVFTHLQFLFSAKMQKLKFMLAYTKVQYCYTII